MSLATHLFIDIWKCFDTYFKVFSLLNLHVQTSCHGKDIWIVCVITVTHLTYCLSASECVQCESFPSPTGSLMRLWLISADQLCSLSICFWDIAHIREALLWTALLIGMYSICVHIFTSIKYRSCTEWMF